MARKKEQKLDLLPDEVLGDAAECLRLLAHPARLRMIEVLMQGRFAVHEIAAICRLNPNQTCDHLRLLKGHKLLDSKRSGRTVFYTVAAPQLAGIIDCIRKSCKIM
jgi:ArsR family transcriptional regulator, zinc-responsive transcriptional repressor